MIQSDVGVEAASEIKEILSRIKFDPNIDLSKEINSSFEQELDRYDAVIFFETAAASGDSITSNNPQRTETAKQAIELDQKLQAIWSRHPNYHFIPSGNSFVEKVQKGLSTIESLVKC